MKLSISNIAWSSEHDDEMYAYLNQIGFDGLEIAPTRIFPKNPYDNIKAAAEFSAELHKKYKLTIPSMQSIWYGITQNIFGTEDDREFLLAYTRKAVDFAAASGCKNLVFGCPKNRVIPDEAMLPVAVGFFAEIGAYAAEKGTVIAIEPNPTIYNTNFINNTVDAFELCDLIDSEGILVNVDLGTIIYNGEDLSCVKENIGLVNHIHISEPNLEVIRERDLHKALKNLNYDRFVSIEMKNQNDIDGVKKVAEYVKEIFA